MAADQCLEKHWACLVLELVLEKDWLCEEGPGGFGKTTSRWFWKRLLAGGFGKDYLQAGSLCTVTSIKLYSFEG